MKSALKGNGFMSALIKSGSLREESPLYIKLASYFVMSLIFFSQFVPTAYVELKIIVMCFAIFAMIPGFIFKKLIVLRWQLHGILLLVFTGTLYSVYGLFKGNPGAIPVLSLWFAWPLVYLFFSTLLVQSNSFVAIAATLKLSLFAVVLYSYLYLGYAAGFVPDYLYLDLDQGQDIGFHDGYIEYRLHSISSLVFLATFYFHHVLETYKLSNRISAVQVALLLLTSTLIFLTGRKALLLVFLALPLSIFISNKLIHNKRKFKLRFFAVSIPLIGFALFYDAILRIGLDFDKIFEMFLSGFDFNSGEDSVTDRSLMFNSLMDGWVSSSVLFGAGNGAVASFVSSQKMPWAYELTYVYLLFSTGLIGFAIYFGWYGYSVWRLRVEMRKRPELAPYVGPLLTGSISFCIAAATNPYLSKFDFLWIVMLPFFLAGWTRYQSKVGTI